MSGWGAITDAPVYILWGECVHPEGEGEKIVRNGWWRCAAAQNRKNFVYYESMKRKLKRKPTYQYECRCSKKGLDVTLEVYYESIKREPKIRGIKKCRCDERLQTKTKEFTRLPYT
jgi:hypothetical protein